MEKSRGIVGNREREYVLELQTNLIKNFIFQIVVAVEKEKS